MLADTSPVVGIPPPSASGIRTVINDVNDAVCTNNISDLNSCASVNRETTLSETSISNLFIVIKVSSLAADSARSPDSTADAST